MYLRWFRHMYEIITIFFWAITYFLILYVGVRYSVEYPISIPLTALVLNFAWEISGSFIFYSPGYIIWMIIDIAVVAICVRSLYHFHRKYIISFFVALIVVTAVYFYIFTFNYVFEYVSFVQDLVMAVFYILLIKRISPHLRVTIGITRLLGDCFAWIAWKEMFPFINYIGLTVLIVNIIYVFYAYYLYLQGSRKNGVKRTHRSKSK